MNECQQFENGDPNMPINRISVSVRPIHDGRPKRAGVTVGGRGDKHGMLGREQPWLEIRRADG